MLQKLISFFVGLVLTIYTGIVADGFRYQPPAELAKDPYVSVGFEQTRMMMHRCANPITHKLYKKTDEKGMPFVWSAAAYTEMLCDAYRLFPGDKTLGLYYRDTLTQVFDRYKVENAVIEAPAATYSGITYYNSSSGHAGDHYYDDNTWVCIQLLQGYKNLGDPALLAAAEKDLVYLWTGWDDALGGGIYWSKKYGSKNTCSNASSAICFLLAYQCTGNPVYLERGKDLYNWMNDTLLDGDLYSDKITLDGEITTWKSAYNQATMIYAGCLLYEITGDESYYNRTKATVDATVDLMFRRTTTADGKTRVSMEAGPIYKAWGVGWLARSYVKFYELSAEKDPLPLDLLAAVLDEEMKTKDADGLYDPFFCSGGSEEDRYTEILAQGGVAATFLNVGYYTAVLKKAGR